jgi:metal-responsive CopG/Arc/MetJ family transcriptional regulator
MKTAVSVDDALMEQADKAARDLGLSRSALVAEALRDFLKHLRQAQVTEQLNRAYADEPSPDERRLVRKLRTKLPVKDAW